MKRVAKKIPEAQQNVKRTKRGSDDECSLEELIAKKRAELVEHRLAAPDLIRQAEDLERRAGDCEAKRWRKRVGAEHRLTAAKLREEAAVRLSMRREHDFERRVVSYVRSYYGAAAPKQAAGRKRPTNEETARSADVTLRQRGRIVDEYLLEVGDAPPRVAMSARDECPRCTETTPLKLCTDTSTMTCPKCGYVLSYLDATSASTAFDEMIDFSPYSYKRVNHFLCWLTLLQGKEAHVVSDSVLNPVMEDLYTRARMRKAEDITQKDVRESLRRLRLRRGYDHVAQITARLSGIKPERVSVEVEEQLRSMFLRMQPAFQRHAPTTRTNFLSYSYVLYRCFQILNIQNVLPGLTLLKGRDKLENNDKIFRLMCADLGWKIPDLPPPTNNLR